jgi:thiamine pyrophosphate-dependent acetolactate synthase large subunit-like protein
MAAKRGKIVLERREVVAEILKHRGDALVVTGLGSPTWDAAAAGDHRLNFYLWGAMGGAAMIGLGLALAQPKRRVLVITGDGEMLMGLGSLATIGVAHPRNLAVVVLDNQHYGETGMQRAHTGRGVELAGVARAANFAAATTIYTGSQLKSWIPKFYRDAGPLFAAAKITTNPVRMILPVREGPQVKNRFREALLGEAAFK